jgi:hypothetical protein
LAQDGGIRVCCAVQANLQNNPFKVENFAKITFWLSLISSPGRIHNTPFSS